MIRKKDGKMGERKLEPGERAPAFSLKDNAGRERGPKGAARLVLYFYPKDFTPGCTVQARDFGEAYGAYREKGYEIYGVSTDSRESHGKFAGDNGVEYPLLSDADGKVARKYGAWLERPGKGEGILRSTFVIERGVVKQARYGVNPIGHAQELLESL